MKEKASIIFSALMVIGIISGCDDSSTFNKKSSPSFTQDTERSIASGPIRGALNSDASALGWLGIPYAAAPIGKLRWHAPASVEPWTDVRDTTTYANVCTQVSSGKTIGAEDCLYLNVWRPNSDETDLPVMVYVHGGSNRTDSGNNYVGDKLATKANAIIVTINYRLDVLGYLTTPALRTGDPLSDSGNYALLDIRKALQWVQENIAAFGGDSSNVTLAGQSAGARDVMASLISPEFKGLYQKAILMSGGETLSTVEAGEATANTVIESLLVKSGTVSDVESAQAWLAAATNEEVSSFLYSQSAQDLVQTLPGSTIRMQPFTHLFMDGVVIPKEGFDIIASGNYNQVPVMLGSNYDEFGAFNLLDPAFFPKLKTGELDQPDEYETFSKSRKYGSQLYASFCVETFAQRLYDAGATDIYSYRMRWGHDVEAASAENVKYIGATHGADVDFVFGYEMNPANGMFANTPLYTPKNSQGRQLLTASVMAYYGDFLHHGAPAVVDSLSWPKWTPVADAAKIMVFNASDSALENEVSAMYWDRDRVMKDMDEDITDAQREVISGVLQGRFFMNGLEFNTLE
ncbi:carboxylesterase type B [Serratia fonticola]|uniref:Carboxylic ester hydrolase n=1 Tax=Serratia fonticola TaxID=47917 RepID=A0A542BRJ2_SERFO|nr:carboxylesterase family protein [Serratia fonticola]TQI81170.1 carboxylesterase type B [Serratia fonticola]TQI96806.1 para-nitrobenzyl esterase [Serratia fonticola]TVZ71302.1 carboxylesterase type B [Serratia fonticola]